MWSLIRELINSVKKTGGINSCLLKGSKCFTHCNSEGNIFYDKVKQAVPNIVQRNNVI